MVLSSTSSIGDGDECPGRRLLDNRDWRDKAITLPGSRGQGGALAALTVVQGPPQDRDVDREIGVDHGNPRAIRAT